MALRLPTYTKCCYCIPLRTGLLIIGYVSIFASCVTIGTVSWSIFKVSRYVEENKDKPNPQHPPDQMAQTALELYISFAYYILVFLYNVAINIVLLIGVHLNRIKYLHFYFKATLFLFVLSIALVVLTYIFMGFLTTIPVLKWSLTLLVCMLIVRSYYLKIEEEEKRPNYEMQAYMPVQQAPTMA